MFGFGKDKKSKSNNKTSVLENLVSDFETDKTARFGHSCETVKVILDQKKTLQYGWKLSN